MGRRTISDEKKVVVKSLADTGMPYRQINEVTGVSLGLITKIVKEFEANQELIEWHRKNKVDVLMQAQLENLAIQQAIRDSITSEEIEKWTPDQKARWYQAAGVDHGIKFDKERLFLSQFTENVSVIIGMINEVKRREWEEELKETEEKKKSE
jgi:transposase